MHEFSLAAQIVENVLEFAETHQAGKILKVRLEIGELACVEAEQLRFCYDSIKYETILEDSSLEIEPRAAVVRCSRCRYQGPPKYWQGALLAAAIPTLQCPDCGQVTEAIEGRECEIKSVQFVSSKLPEAAVQSS